MFPFECAARPLIASGLLIFPRVTERWDPAEGRKKQKTGPKARPVSPLFANAELVDDRAIPREVGLLEVIEKTAAAADELQKAAAAVMILRVRLEVLGQVSDAIGEKC